MLLAFGALLALIVLCNLLGRVATRVGLPDLIGFLAAGFLLGAGGLDLIGAQRADLLPVEVWRGLGDLGLAALMISAGMSMSTRFATAAWREIVLLSLAILACLVPAYLTAPLLMDAGADPALAVSADSALAYRGTLALAVAVTSVPFLTRILTNTALLETPFGGAVLATACIVDLAVWSLFPLLVDIRNGEAANPTVLAGKPLLAIFFLAALLVLAAVQRRWAKTDAGAARFAPGACLVLAAAFCFAAALWLNVGTMLASLAFGIFLSRSQAVTSGLTSANAKRLLNWVLVPLYFALVGAGLALDQDVAAGLILAFLAWSSLIKVTMVLAAAASVGAGVRGSLGYALALNTRGGPGIVLGSLALNAGIFGAPTFLALVVASIVTAAAAEAGLELLKRASARAGESGLFELPQVQPECSLGGRLR